MESFLLFVFIIICLFRLPSLSSYLFYYISYLNLLKLLVVKTPIVQTKKKGCLYCSFENNPVRQSRPNSPISSSGGSLENVIFTTFGLSPFHLFARTDSTRRTPPNR